MPNLTSLKQYCLGIALTTFLVGCSTIDRGVVDHARVDSVPQGANVTLLYIENAGRPGKAEIKTQHCQATPCAFQLPRRRIAKITIKNDGYETAEYMIGPSRLRGGINVSLSKAIPTTLGIGALWGASVAALSQTVVALANAFTFGAAQGQGISTASGAAVGTGAGVVVVAGSILVDAGTGANANLFPNPVVIGLADQKGGPVLDPLVLEYDKWIAALQLMKQACSNRQSSSEIRETCREATRAYEAARDNYKAAEERRNQTLIEIVKEQQKLREQAEDPS